MGLRPPLPPSCRAVGRRRRPPLETGPLRSCRAGAPAALRGRPSPRRAHGDAPRRARRRASRIALSGSPVRIVRLFLEEVTDAAAREFIRDVVPAEQRRARSGPEAAVAAALAGRRPDLRSSRRSSRASATTVSDFSSRFRKARSSSGSGSSCLRAKHPTRRGASRYHLVDRSDDSRPRSTRRRSGSNPGGDDPARRPALRRAPGGAPRPPRRRPPTLSPAVARSLEERHPGRRRADLRGGLRLPDARGASPLGVGHPGPPAGRRAARARHAPAPRRRRRAGRSLTRFGLDTSSTSTGASRWGRRPHARTSSRSWPPGKIPLVAIRGEWVLLDREHLERTLRLFDRRPGGRTTLGEFLRLAGGLDAEAGAYPVEAVSGEGWLQDLPRSDGSAARDRRLHARRAGLVGTLRPYQSRGVAWMRFLTARGLGACLADDMGLGKTIQFLAVLLAAREAGEAIAPVAPRLPDLGRRELAQRRPRASPRRSRVAVHHGPERAAGAAFRRAPREDRPPRDDVRPRAPRPRPSRSRRLGVRRARRGAERQEPRRRAVAGRPGAQGAAPRRPHRHADGEPALRAEVDLRLPEPRPPRNGRRSSAGRFALPIERQRDAAATDRLRRADGAVPAAPRQDRPRGRRGPPREDRDEGVRRPHARAGGALPRDDPVAPLGNRDRRRDGAGGRASFSSSFASSRSATTRPSSLRPRDASPARSAKLSRLLSLLEETIAERSPALVFTQFARDGKAPRPRVEEHFGNEVLFLHGGVPRRARAEMVRRFQEDDDPPLVFVVSLRAGGSGLNLTRASHVFHFDRWWNPAVEEQATDRAFRIGQTQNVQVHKFVCRGTLEERIDRLLDEKKLPGPDDRRLRGNVARRPDRRRDRRSRLSLARGRGDGGRRMTASESEPHVASSGLEGALGRRAPGLRLGRSTSEGANGAPRDRTRRGRRDGPLRRGAESRPGPPHAASAPHVRGGDAEARPPGGVRGEPPCRQPSGRRGLGFLRHATRASSPSSRGGRAVVQLRRGASLQSSPRRPLGHRRAARVGSSSSPRSFEAGAGRRSWRP